MEDLANDTSKKFDYIIFTSAKDRYYNYFTGDVQAVEGNTETFDAFIRHINSVICNQDSLDENNIILTQNKVLMVIDDLKLFQTKKKRK